MGSREMGKLRRWAREHRLYIKPRPYNKPVFVALFKNLMQGVCDRERSYILDISKEGGQITVQLIRECNLCFYAAKLKMSGQPDLLACISTKQSCKSIEAIGYRSLTMTARLLLPVAVKKSYHET